MLCSKRKTITLNKMQSCKRICRPYAIRQFPRGCGRVSDKPEESSESEERESFSLTDKMSSAAVDNRRMVGNDSVVRSVAGSAAGSRGEVQEVLKLYRQILKRLENDEKSKAGKSGNLHEHAAMVLRRNYKWVNMEKRLGSVLGVEIGDEFGFRAELHIIGLHRQFQKGIDYMEKDGIMLATSIVATNRYANYMKSPDVLIYYGEGGNPRVRNRIPVNDQVLELGNLALKNSMEAKTPVRVISSKVKSSKLLKIVTRKKNLSTITTYVYDGLYLVEKLWQERGEFGKLVFKFQLRRIPGQTRAPSLTKSMNYQFGRLMNDISGGKEKIPISVINTVDNERPLPFNYITSMDYTDCPDDCSSSEDCSYQAKNGQEIPYDISKRLVREKPCISECGPSCKCSDSCRNRVTQLGLQFQLEVFKTESKGWGVRSRSYIRAGSFVCEYIGKICRAKEVEPWFGRTDYLLDIGDNHNQPHCLCNSENFSFCKKITGLTIDASHCGNVGRFINHSCRPNLDVKIIVFDRKMPHVMLFAKEDIPPFKELTYDYSYRVGEFRYMTGNLKVKDCMCKSANCTGQFY